MDALAHILAKFNVAPDAASPVRLRISRHSELLALWAELGYRQLVEVGTEEGRFAEQICQANPEAHLTCVDPYLAYARYKDQVRQDRLDHYYEVARRRMSKYNCAIIRQPSLDAAQQFKPRSLDAVFIDGNHHFDFVVQDIIAWAPLVRKGGMVAGHDYKPEGQEETPIPFGVIEAVNAYTAAHKIAPFFLCVRDKCPSWLWINS